MIASTMQEFPLTITAVLRHGMSVYADTECVTWTDAGPRRSVKRLTGAGPPTILKSPCGQEIGKGRPASR